MTEALIGFGGNLGEVVSSFAGARARLAMLPDTRILASSSLYRTAPQGLLTQADFLNAVVHIQTGLAPLQLLRALLAIEAELGRRRDPAQRDGPRVIDLDVLDFGGLSLELPDLQLPHPRMHTRAFVLVPLLEVLGDVELAGARLSHWLERLPEQPVLRLPPHELWS